MNTFFSRPLHCVSFSLPALLLTLLMLLTASVTGCSVLDPGPAPSLLQLNPTMPAPLAAAPLHKGQMVVAMPVAGRDLDTDGIALIFQGREVRYLAGSRWANSVPQLLQRNIIDALTSSNAFSGVSGESAGIAATMKLLSEVRRFNLRYADSTSPPTAEVVLALQILDLNTGRIIAAKNLQANVPATGTDNIALATAAEVALSHILGETVTWVATTTKSTAKRR